MSDKTKRTISVAIFALNLAAIVWFWVSDGSGTVLHYGSGGILLALGNLAGLCAAYFALWQLLIISRVSWLERPWGHDRLSRIHHYVGLITLGAVAVHPVLLTFGYSSLLHTGLINQFSSFVINFENVFAALIGYILFLVIVVMAFNIVMSKLKYETWYFIHVLLYLAIILAFNHQTSVGRDLASTGVAIYWQALFFLTFILVFYYRLAKPILSFWKHDFRVSQVKQETQNIVSITISGKDLRSIKAKAGQFVIVRFLSPGLWWQAHPFSFSAIPEDTWRLTIKALGDFTSQLASLPIGTKVIVEGPLGRFTSDMDRNRKVLLIAGGIGISPIRALAEQFLDEGRQVYLIYSVRNENDICLRAELESLVQRGLHLHYVISNKIGRVTGDMLKELVPDVAERSVFICGPTGMMHAMRKDLIVLGVDGHSIYFEEFQLG